MKKITFLFSFFLLVSWQSHSQCSEVVVFNENFDGVTIPALPNCWGKIIRGQNVAMSDVRTLNYNGAISGSKVVALDNEDATTNYDVILVSPELSTLSTGAYRLRFFADGYAANSLQIGTLNNNTITAEFNMIQQVTTTTNFEEHIVDFSSYTGTDKYIGIRLNTSSMYNSIFLDDIKWELAPLCPDISSLHIPFVSPNTATVAWTAGGTETQWQLAYGETSVIDPSTLTAATVDNTPTKSIDGLESNHSYNVWIRSSCGANIGNWIGPIVFTTACTEVSTLIENFDTTDATTLPNCWSKIIRGPGTINSVPNITITQQSYSLPNAIELYEGGASTFAGDDVILVSPNLSNIAAGTHRLKFYARGGAEIEIGTLNTNTKYATFTSFQTVQITQVYNEYVVDFEFNEVTDSYIGFRLKAAAGGLIPVSYIDDVRWEPTPSCPDVSEISVPLITSSTATVTWNQGAVQSQVVYGAWSVNDPDTLTPMTINSEETALIPSLQSNTQYKVWVRSVCGLDFGAWIGPVVFKTACSPATTIDENFDTVTAPELPGCWSAIVKGDNLGTFAYVRTVDFGSYSGPNAVRIFTSGSTGEYDLILVSPNLGNLGAGTHRLKFRANGNSNLNLEIGTLSGNTNNDEFNFFQNIAVTTVNNEIVVEFDSYEGTDTYIGFRITPVTLANRSIIIDNVIWELYSSCPDVSNINIAATTTSTANITWDEGGTETNWQVAHSIATNTNPDNATISGLLDVQSAEFTDLVADTEYKVWVRSVCGLAQGNGIWTGPVKFRTPCIPTTTFNENFDAVTVPDLPQCWSAIKRGPSVDLNAVIEVYGQNANSSPNLIQLSNAMSPVGNDLILVSPSISNLSAGTHQLSFYVRAYVASSIQIGTLNSSAAGAIFTPFETIEVPYIEESIEFTHHVIDFESYTGTDTFIGIRHNGSTNYSTILLDDIKWEETLNIEGFDKQRIAYYPNPVKEMFNLSYQETIINVIVFNLLGQEVLNKDINAKQAQLDMSSFSAGAYILKVTTSNSIETLKIIKE